MNTAVYYCHAMQDHLCFSKLNPSTSTQHMRTLQHAAQITHLPEILGVPNTPSLGPAGDIITLLCSSQDNILATSLSSNKTKLVLNKTRCVHV